jgi:alpha-L-arabinofuranosidase
MARNHSWRILAAAWLGAAGLARAQTPLPIYTDHLVNGFQDWSWAPDNLENTSPVYSGSDSISVSGGDWEALWLEQTGFDTSLYTNLSFYINGGAGGKQVIQVVGVTNGSGASAYTLPALAANKWVPYTIPFSSLGLDDQTNCNGFFFQITSSGTTNTFYIDAVELGPAPAPAITHITVNAANALRTADTRWFGVNTAIWDSDFDTTQTVSELNEVGFQFLRFPGGSASDDYNWATDESGTNTWQWATSFDDFAQVATNIRANVILTANYGTGTPAEAAGWVSYANVTRHYGFKYWEIGNEVYGTWETDSNIYPNDPYTYAVRAHSYIQQMKAADPTIKIGVVVTTGEDTDSNGYTNHPATNSATGQTHNGWTPVLLSTLKNLGVTPDFAIYHWYPEYTDTESDPLLLQGTSNWAGDAANLRQMITDYFGPGGTNIELLCTENNSNSGEQGKQSVSLVNALYYADSLGQLMKTEFNSYVWWDLRNGIDTDGNMDPTLYGWRTYGDLGLVNGSGDILSNRYPQFFTAKLMRHFIRAGDTVLDASSDYGLVSAYAARRLDGSLTLLAVNKSAVSNLTANIVLTNYTPGATAALYSYGMPQDNAANTGLGSCDIAQTNLSGVSANFNYTFAPYSVTVFAFPPASPALSAKAPPAGAGQFVLRISGQPGVPYVLQNSSDLSAWTSVSTNILTGNSANITNAVGAGGQFWRAVWLP